MKIIIISLLLVFTVNAQTVWYVNRDATGSYTGRDWTNAWADFDSIDYWGNHIGINWSIIQAGDTIYVSGGSDSTVYNTNSPAGIEIGTVGSDAEMQTYAPGNPVIIAPAWQSGHNGGVYLVCANNSHSRVLSIGNKSNIKLTGFNIIDARTYNLAGGGIMQLGNADWGDIDSLIMVDNCYIYSKGFASLVTLSGSKNSFTNNYMETGSNEYGYEQDQFGINGGRGGHTITGNIVVARNHLTDTSYSANASVTVTANSFTDTRLSMTTNQYLGASVWVGDAFLNITSNIGNTFYGAQWDSFDVDGNRFDAVTPANGSAWTLFSDAHRDGIQMSNQGYFQLGERLQTTIANNLYVDYHEGGSHQNNMIYNYGWTGTNDMRILIYNNIMVNRKNQSGIGAVAIGRYYEGSYSDWNSIYLLNNTFISGGTSGSMFTFWSADTLVMKNNLWIKDFEAPNILNLENGQSLWSNVVRAIDYNRYFEAGGQSNPFAANIDSVNWADWHAHFDQNSDYRNSTEVTFTNKYGLNIADYYTTVGRDSGQDLSAIYPFLATDILGNPRTGTWDIGALEYQNGSWTPPDTTATVTFTSITNAELNSYHIAYGVVSGIDSTSHVWTATSDSFAVNYPFTLGLTIQEIENGDTIGIPNIASGSYSTANVNTIVVSGTNRTFTVTTKAYVPPSSGSSKIFKGSNGGIIRDSTGKIIKTQ